MYICNHCGKTFDEPQVSTTTHGTTSLGACFYENWTESPCCQDGFSEAVICEKCGEAFSEEDQIGKIELCPKCQKAALEKFESIFTAAEIDYLRQTDG